ncbi:MAG: hypothetical protein Q8P30_01720 [Candidatus Uhrbacteria bacterium]|nr:hypothetical protein [Candidatus Uhrbacteria bacterium]
MKKIFLSIFILILFMPAVALADIGPDPGFHEYYYCAYVDNINDYPDYDIYSTLNWRFGPSLILAYDASEIFNDSCEYRNRTSAPFLAIVKDNQDLIVHKDDDERGDLWDTLPENEQYFIHSSVTGSLSDISDEFVNGFIPDSNPIYARASIYHIDNLDADSFEVSLISESMYDESQQLISMEVVEDSAVGNSRSSIILTIVLVGTGFFLIWLSVKRWKK